MSGGDCSRVSRQPQPPPLGFRRCAYCPLWRDHVCAVSFLPCGPEPAVRQGELEIVNVTYTYPGAQRPVLSGVSLHIQPGEVVAIVGDSGAGKTTLSKLIARFYDLDEGSSRLDGVNLKAWSVDDLHRSIGFLAQGSARCLGNTTFRVDSGSSSL